MYNHIDNSVKFDMHLTAKNKEHFEFKSCNVEVSFGDPVEFCDSNVLVSFGKKTYVFNTDELKLFTDILFEIRSRSQKWEKEIK